MAGAPSGGALRGGSYDWLTDSVLSAAGRADSDLAERHAVEPDTEEFAIVGSETVEAEIVDPGSVDPGWAATDRSGPDTSTVREQAPDRPRGRRVGSAWAAIRPARGGTDRSEVAASFPGLGSEPDPGELRFGRSPDDVGDEAERGPERGRPRFRLPGRRVRLDPGRPGAVALLVTAGVSAVATAVVTWLASPSVEPVEPEVTPAARSLPADAPAGQPAGAGAGPSGSVAATPTSTIVVSVVGAVARPGLLTLPAGSRVADALAAAGGALPGVDTLTLNLARRLADGEQVAVGVPAADQAAGAGGAVPESVPGGVVNLNLATVGELDTLPGVGPVIAQRIVDYRDANGPFQSVDQLGEVSGIGPATLEKLREQVTV